MRAIWRPFELLLAALCLAGCAGTTYPPDSAPEYLVRRDQTPLYRLGPQQAGAPEAWLSRNDRVRMLRREFGYSYMLLSDGQTGYVANDALVAEGAETPPPSSSSRPAARPDLNAMPVDAPPRGGG